MQGADSVAAVGISDRRPRLLGCARVLGVRHLQSGDCRAVRAPLLLRATRGRVPRLSEGQFGAKQ